MDHHDTTDILVGDCRRLLRASSDRIRAMPMVGAAGMIQTQAAVEKAVARTLGAPQAPESPPRPHDLARLGAAVARHTRARGGAEKVPGIAGPARRIRVAVDAAAEEIEDLARALPDAAEARAATLRRAVGRFNGDLAGMLDTLSRRAPVPPQVEAAMEAAAVEAEALVEHIVRAGTEAAIVSGKVYADRHPERRVY
jgi:hypothetical protein